MFVEHGNIMLDIWTEMHIDSTCHTLANPNNASRVGEEMMVAIPNPTPLGSLSAVVVRALWTASRFRYPYYRGGD